MANSISDERTRRKRIWEQLVEAGGPDGVSPSLLRKLGIYGGAQGIWVDKERTNSLTPWGVTVSVLHTGKVYADDLSDDGVLYYYPRTGRSVGRDLSEIRATKSAAELQLPIFVITHPTPSSSKRNVRIASVEDWNDQANLFLIEFGGAPHSEAAKYGVGHIEPFVLEGHARKRTTETATRGGQQRFKFRALQLYGQQCVVCDINILDVLEVTHIRPTEHNGSDHPKNSLVLCALHHRAYDKNLFCIEPNTTKIFFRDSGPDAQALRITRSSLDHLCEKPHPKALRWRWRKSLGAPSRSSKKRQKAATTQALF